MRSATPVAPTVPWQLVVASDSADRFQRSSRVERDGTVVLADEPGGWLRLYAVEPGHHLLEGQVDVRGGPENRALGSTAPVAKVHIAQFAEPVTIDEIRSGSAAHRAVQIESLRSTGPLNASIDVEPGTSCIAVSVSSPGSEAAPGVECRVSDLRLLRSGFAELLMAVAKEGGPFEPRDLLPTGAFRIGMVERPSMALAPGSEAVFRLNDAPRGVSVETHVALTSPLARSDDRVRYVCEVVGEDGAVLESESRVLKLSPAEDNRWAALELPLGDGTRDGLRLRFRTERVSGAGLVLPLISAPRVISKVSEKLPNLLVVSIDTLRADHVGAYGYERDTTPRIDALAGEGIVFRDCWAQSSYTLPSHMSLFSGQLPSRHGIDQPDDRLDEARTTLLAEILREHGYSTAAFTGGGFLDPKFGFARGFDQFGTFDPVLNPESDRVREFLDSVPGVSPDTIEEFNAARVVDWIERRRTERFFVFFHTYAPHDFDAPDIHREQLGLSGDDLSADTESQAWLAHGRYRPQRPIREDEVASLVDHYDAAIRAADAAVGEILDGLRRLDLWEDTIVVLTSDHGKEFGERGRFEHGHSLYEEMLQVPLIVRVPGREHAVIDDPAMLVDVVPTVLAQLGLPPPAGVQGRDLLTLDSPRPLFAELDFGHRLQAFREGAQKTIYRPAKDPLADLELWQVECFDLEQDPAESTPVAPAPFVPRVRALRSYLQTLADDMPSGANRSAEIPEDLRRRLRALGYDF